MVEKKTRTRRHGEQTGKNAAWKLGVRQVWNDTNLLYETTTATKEGCTISWIHELYKHTMKKNENRT